MKNIILSIGLVFFTSFIFSQDNFVKEIPKHDNGEYSLGYRLCKMKSKGLKLKKIEEAGDKLEIRIWFDNTRKRVQDVLVLRKKGNKWQGSVYAYTRQWNTFNETERVKKKLKFKVEPKSGWDEFIPKLMALRIADLANMDDIKGLTNASVYGKSYTIEYADDKKYRFYNYHTPERFYKDYEDVADMLKIVRLLNEEFAVEKRQKTYRDLDKFKSKARKKRERTEKTKTNHEKK